MFLTWLKKSKNLVLGNIKLGQFLFFSKTNLSCVIVNALEWYDFVIYGFFAESIGKLFFPASNPIAHLMMSLGVFSIGLLARPIGAFLFGRIGDKLSRKRALISSLYLMAFPTFFI